MDKNIFTIGLLAISAISLVIVYFVTVHLQHQQFNALSKTMDIERGKLRSKDMFFVWQVDVLWLLGILMSIVLAVLSIPYVYTSIGDPVPLDSAALVIPVFTFLVLVAPLLFVLATLRFQDRYLFIVSDLGIEVEKFGKNGPRSSVFVRWEEISVANMILGGLTTKSGVGRIVLSRGIAGDANAYRIIVESHAENFTNLGASAYRNLSPTAMNQLTSESFRQIGARANHDPKDQAEYDYSWKGFRRRGGLL
jgi:hypothetical protein